MYTRDHGHTEDLGGAVSGLQVELPVEARVLVGVGDVEALSGARHEARHALVVAEAVGDLALHDHELLLPVVHQVQRALVRIGQLARALSQREEHGMHARLGMQRLHDV